MRIDQGLSEYVDGWVSGWVESRQVGRPTSRPDGWYVRTGTDRESQRVVLTSGTTQAVHEVAESLHLRASCLKFAGDQDMWMPVLPQGWAPDAPGWLMTTDLTRRPESARLPDGYRADVEHNGGQTVVRIRTRVGEVAASGQCGRHDEWAVPDQIVTAPEHRRRGLGVAVMATLAELAWTVGARRTVLGATAQGRALYTRLGWTEVAPLMGAYFRRD